ncbi:O-antigen ligase family protein [Polynucleobacter sp. AM-25C3]|uniref:O-antigen ligase family protein n=1 Tax=Polynucleobacter sp. AM-25C3 TaxID=1855569 RepID=UPI001C0AD87B|nr:O-antigen ligase family protein [Polynucleobacter sp. AM-25C3]MBU3601784.1 O-antigen ligase family protein [Polynucleobacter sp. AM-25C3]
MKKKSVRYFMQKVSRASIALESLMLALLVAIMTLPRSYTALKLSLLMAIILLATPQIRMVIGFMKKVDVIGFYCSVAILGCLWTIVGLINGGIIPSLIDYFRLYVGWSLAYLIMVSLIYIAGGLYIFHRAAVLSAILISLINIAGVLDVMYGFYLIPESVSKSLAMNIGFHEGYIQITSSNIGSLFFLVTYLIAIYVRKDTQLFRNPYTHIALVLGLICAALSGRRALWVTIALQPLVLLVAFIFAGGRNRFRFSFYSIFLYGLTIIFLVSAVSGLLDIDFTGTLEHLYQAFSDEDVRYAQRQGLINGFFDHLIIGSGFGGNIFSPDDERAGTYESTFHQILFNFGIVGVSLILFIFFRYLRICLVNTKALYPLDGVSFCLIIGLLSFLIGAYSNPYLGSFDFLLYIAILPLIAGVKSAAKFSTNKEASKYSNSTRATD